jgi:hypothetical protein
MFEKNLKTLLIFMLLMGIKIVTMEKVPEQARDTLTLAKLSDEILVNIFQYIADAETPEQVIQNIKNARLVNKKFADLLNDPLINRELIKKLRARFADKTDLGTIAQRIDAQGAYQGLQKYLATDEGKNDFTQSLMLAIADFGTGHKEKIEKVKKLLSLGVNLNQIYFGGILPLQYAMAYGNIPLLKLLLDYGANPSQSSLMGQNAYDFLMAIPASDYTQEVEALFRSK